jgi:hypothetical protein
MNESTLTRRDVHRLALAALGGLVTGAIAGCSGKPTGQGTGKTPEAKAPETDPGKGKTAATPGPGKEAGEPVSRLLEDPHVCRGINTCKNKGKKGTTNECAGQAHCATVAAHDCNGMNDCKGQGGCGEHPGENACKGKGGCEVPLSDKTWPKARKRFEELMTRAGKKFGEAPPKGG